MNPGPISSIRLRPRSTRPYPPRRPRCTSSCATRRAGSSRKSAPPTSAMTATPNCRSRIGTSAAICGSSERDDLDYPGTFVVTPAKAGIKGHRLRLSPLDPRLRGGDGSVGAEPMTRPIDRLLQIMARLRDPEHGCPWDKEQNFRTIAPYTIEEAYEVADAIERADMGALKDELGDLLLQVVFHAQMAEEAGHFAFDDVAAAIADKMVRRHPHVFGDARIRTVAAQNEAWEAHKAAERAQQGGAQSVVDGVALALPALLRAAKISGRAARIGFDWPDARAVIPKIAEEVAELEAELAKDAPAAAREEELGDLLFAVANLARQLEIEPETALRRATAKFERRFRRVEALARERGIGHDLEALEALWQEVKRNE